MRGTRPDRTDGTRRVRHAAAPARRRRLPWRTIRGRLIAGGITLLLIIIVVASGVVIGHHLIPRSSPPAAKPSTAYTAVPAAPPNATAVPGSAPSTSAAPGPAPDGLSALRTEFAQLKDKLNAQVGVVIGAVGADQVPIVLGGWQHGAAWSTMKVPLTIAALQQDPQAGVTDTMKAAITESDNAAAESISPIPPEPSSRKIV